MVQLHTLQVFRRVIPLHEHPHLILALRLSHPNALDPREPHVVSIVLRIVQNDTARSTSSLVLDETKSMAWNDSLVAFPEMYVIYDKHLATAQRSPLFFRRSA